MTQRNATQQSVLLATAALVSLLGGPRCLHAQAALPTGFTDELVVSGLAFPVGMAFLPDGRLLVIEQKTARIMMVRQDVPAKVDSVGFVAGVTSSSSSSSELGLLGIAVDPDWPARPYVYVHSTHTSLKVRISRFTATGALSDPDGMISIGAASRYELITDIPNAAQNHNGGTVRFGPDHMLYVSLGEDATASAAQDTSSLRGVILRLDVSGLPDGPGIATRGLITPADNPFVGVGGLNSRLIWAYGLRNPFRFQIDRLTGNLLITDVGQFAWEEVDEAVGGGRNFGWSHYEGNAIYNSSAPLTGPVTPPIYVMNQSEGVSSVMSAGIYRRPEAATRGFPLLYEGSAFISDYYAGFMRRLTTDGTWKLADPVPGQPSAQNWATGLNAVTDYAIGAEGALWYVRQYVGSLTRTGQIRRIVPSASTPVSGAGPERVSFAAPFPRPSAGAVALSWTLASPGSVSLAILDVRGRRVRTLIAGRKDPAGRYQSSWDGRGRDGRPVQSGLYFVRLTVNDRHYEHRMPIIR